MRTTRKSLKNYLRRTKPTTTTTRRRRRLTAILRRRAQARAAGRKSTCFSSKSKAVSDKLEALKKLIPGHMMNNINGGEGGSAVVKADELFQETADYIVLLRTRVLVLQRLIHFYGSMQQMDNQNVVIL